MMGSRYFNKQAERNFSKWFERLYNRYFEQLYRYAYSITKNKQLAEDVVAEVFTNIWKSKPNHQHIAEPAAYLHVSVKHLAIRLASKDPGRFNNSLYSESLQISDAVDPENLMLGKELDELITAILDELPPHCRIVYDLAHNKGYSHQEIANEMGISKRTVETHIYQAIRKLKQGLRSYYNKTGDAYKVLGKFLSLAGILNALF